MSTQELERYVRPLSPSRSSLEEKIEEVMSSARAEFHDVESVQNAQTQSDLLAVLRQLPADTLSGAVRPGTTKQQHYNYGIAARAYHRLKSAIELHQWYTMVV